MKITNHFVLLIISLTFICFACGSKEKQQLVAEIKLAEPVITQAQIDTASVDIFESHNTPHMNAGKLEEYYSINNKYKHWDKGKAIVIIGFGCAKDGTTFNVQLRRSSEVEELDKEAVRLIENLVMDNPAKDALGNPLRVRNVVIPVSFPMNK